jgi:hypothetical protein
MMGVILLLLLVTLAHADYNFDRGDDGGEKPPHYAQEAFLYTRPGQEGAVTAYTDDPDWSNLINTIPTIGTVCVYGA